MYKKERITNDATQDRGGVREEGTYTRTEETSKNVCYKEKGVL